MANPLLKFYRGTAAPSAPEKGMVWFLNTGNEAIIKVYNGESWDVYGATVKSVADVIARVKDLEDMSHDFTAADTVLRGELETLITNEYNRAKGIEDDLAQRIGVIEASSATKEGENGPVKVEVSTAAGVVTGVTVTTSDIASAQGLADEIDRAKAAEGANAKAIADEAAAARAAEKALGERIDAIPAATVTGVVADDKILALNGTELMSTLSFTKEEVDGAECLVVKGNNGVVIGKVETAAFTADSFLDDVVLEGDVLKFTWKMADGSTKSDSVEIAKYIDTYTAGNGLDLTDKSFSVKRDATSESFLTVGADGIKLSGVQSAIDAAVAGKNVSASGDTYVSAVAEGNAVTVTASESTKASLALADSALQASNITTGSANGTISVKGSDVAVKGLGAAAYQGIAESITPDAVGLATAAAVATFHEPFATKVDANEVAITALQATDKTHSQAIVDINARIDQLNADFGEKAGVSSITAEAAEALQSKYVQITVVPETGKGAVKLASNVQLAAMPTESNGVGTAGLATDTYVKNYVASQLTWVNF